MASIVSLLFGAMWSTIMAWMMRFFGIPPAVADAFAATRAPLVTAPQPVGNVGSNCRWAPVTVASRVGVVVVSVIIGFVIVRFILWMFVTEVARGFAVDVVTEVLVIPTTWLIGMFVTDRDRLRLQPAVDLGNPPQIRWAVQDSLVAMTDAIAQGPHLQHFLRECAASATSDLQLAPNVSVPCTAFGSQFDGPPLMTALRRDSRALEQNINRELAREFNDFGKFLQFLRTAPAAEVLNLWAPSPLTASRWQSISYQVKAVYNTVWCRWIRQMPRSTLESRTKQLRDMIQDGAARREIWHKELKSMAAKLNDKNNGACPDCKRIEEEARKLGPISLSSSPFEVQRIHYANGVSARQRGEEETTKEQVEPERTTKDTKALIEKHAQCFGLQNIAAQCVAKCTMLDDHCNGLAGLLAWVEAEMGWWDQFNSPDGVSLPVEIVALSEAADIHRFEELLDRMARDAMARGGPR